VITIHQRYRQTDRQTTCDRNTALCTKVHRAVKTPTLLRIFSIYGVCVPTANWWGVVYAWIYYGGRVWSLGPRCCWFMASVRRTGLLANVRYVVINPCSQQHALSISEGPPLQSEYLTHHFVIHSNTLNSPTHARVPAAFNERLMLRWSNTSLTVRYVIALMQQASALSAHLIHTMNCGLGHRVNSYNYIVPSSQVESSLLFQ